MDSETPRKTQPTPRRRKVRRAIRGLLLAAAAVFTIAILYFAARVVFYRQVDDEEHLADALGAGLSLTGALMSAAEITPEPMARELRTTTREIRAGQRVERALENLQLRVPDPGLEVMSGAIASQRSAGGDLSAALRNVSEQLSERERLTREVRGATAQARLTGALVACLPLVAGVGVEVARPGLLAGVLGGPTLVLVTTSLLMQGVGILLIRRIARVDV